MVNLQKWDFISFNDIKEGDEIKVITTGNRKNYTTKTVTRATVVSRGWNAWYGSDDFRITSDPETKSEGFTVEIYRRKPKPFNFPTSFGSIIQVSKSIDPESVGHRAIRGNGYFVLNQSGMWRNESGEGFNVPELLKFFTGFKVISKGVEV
jgi:hypothetical protein